MSFQQPQAGPQPTFQAMPLQAGIPYQTMPLPVQVVSDGIAFDLGGLRDQILANITILYPIALSAENESLKTVPTPAAFHLITFAQPAVVEGPLFSTRVIVDVNRKTDKGSIEKERMVLCEGPVGRTQGEALVMLLEWTATLLGRSCFQHGDVPAPPKERPHPDGRIAALREIGGAWMLVRNVKFGT